MSERINLNADLGESFGAWRIGDDAAMLQLVRSANIACGFHAGDPLVMQKTVAMARRCGVSIGAHPGFPDLQGFGRRRMEIAADELAAMLIYQVGALAAIARAEGATLTHVKPHGALSNMACVDAALAATVAGAVHRLDPTLILLAPALSQLAAAGRAAGLAVVEEIFADRAYLADGSLVPRARPGAVIEGADACLRHVLAILEGGALISIDGERVPVQAQSVCVHGDNADAIASARAIGSGLQAVGYTLVAIPELVAADRQ